MTTDVIRPAAHLRSHIDHILKYYDEHIEMNQPVIGIHLRIEPDMKLLCGNAQHINDRLCYQLGVPCSSSTCIVATGSPREEYEVHLKCQQILTKHEAWSEGNSPLDLLGREENAIIDLWTVTRAHIFAGCGVSTMSMAGWALHQFQLNEWQLSSLSARTAASMIFGSVDLIQSAINDPGLLEYGRGCHPTTSKWIDDHPLIAAQRPQLCHYSPREPLTHDTTRDRYDGHHHRSGPLSNRLIMIPSLIGDTIVDQLMLLQYIIDIAQTLKAAVCWPRVALTNNNHEEKKEKVFASFGRLFDEGHFKGELKQHRNIKMVATDSDHQFCEYAYTTMVALQPQASIHDLHISLIPFSSFYFYFLSLP
jgi:hypothetical protein